MIDLSFKTCGQAPSESSNIDNVSMPELSEYIAKHEALVESCFQLPNCPLRPRSAFAAQAAESTSVRAPDKAGAARSEGPATPKSNYMGSVRVSRSKTQSPIVFAAYAPRTWRRETY